MLVDSNNKLVGLLTDRDIVMNVVLISVDWETTKVSHIMRPSFDLLSETSTVGDAINVLALSRGRDIPLHFESGGYGIVTTTQILWFIHQRLHEPRAVETNIVADD